MNENDEKSALERQSAELLTLATEYFRVLENIGNIEKNDFLSLIHKLCSLLYAKGLLFPGTDEPDNTGNERFVTEEEWENVFNSIRAKLEDQDSFSYIENIDQPEDIVTGSLAEILTDVYQDMKDFALLLTKPTQLAYDNAVYEIKRLFRSHWGFRILLALQVLHSRSYPEVPENKELDW